MQATTPMGFTWSVVLAHACMQNTNELAYAELVSENPWLDTRLQFLRDIDAPFKISPRRPLVLLILDDQATITLGWLDALVMEFYKKLRQAMERAGIPIAWKKSSTPDHVAKRVVPFIGHEIHLTKKTIRPNPQKWAKVAAAVAHMRVDKAYSYERWQSLLCRLSWFAG